MSPREWGNTDTSKEISARKEDTLMWVLGLGLLLVGAFLVPVHIYLAVPFCVAGAVLFFDGMSFRMFGQ